VKDRRPHRTQTCVPLIAGLSTAILTQPTDGWWLDSPRGVLLTLTSLFLVSVLVGRVQLGSRSLRAAALWGGAMAGLCVCLWWIGPGTIWPIVLVVAAGLTGSAVAGGSVVGWLWRV